MSPVIKRGSSAALVTPALLVGLCLGTALAPVQRAAAQESATPAVESQTEDEPAPVSTPAAPLASGAAARAAPVMVEHSPWGMFLAADSVVKGVMAGLAFASLVTWTICIAKSVEIALARASLRAGMRRLASARFLSEADMALAGTRGVVPMLVSAALSEAGLAAELGRADGLGERVSKVLSEIARREARAIRAGTGLLATIGSTAPFVGLFGTVWGIMNSFIGISKSQTTNLAVVAPGIAEALLATAIGLVAAIPAVVIYNLFARQTKAYLDSLGDAVGRTELLLSRDLDLRGARPLSRAAE